MDIQGIDHIHLDVKSPEVIAGFLSRLGFEVVRKTDHAGGSVELRVPGSATIIELTSTHGRPDKPRPAGLRHIALRVDAIDAAFESLTAQGFTFRDTPHDSEDTGRRVVNLTDPEGGTLQLSTDMA